MPAHLAFTKLKITLKGRRLQALEAINEWLEGSITNSLSTSRESNCRGVVLSKGPIWRRTIFSRL
jgi:hypothetical protein